MGALGRNIVVIDQGAPLIGLGSMAARRGCSSAPAHGLSRMTQSRQKSLNRKIINFRQPSWFLVPERKKPARSVLRWIKRRPVESRLTGYMGAFIYRCPTMGLNVQGWFADEVTANEGDNYETVTCLACRQVHLVNRDTGRTLGDEE